jgi:phenylpyruvate tautomerase PptA (4-oxalocrotonate tautomerase family)
VLVQITLARGRPVEKKEALYRRIAKVLSERAAADLA